MRLQSKCTLLRAPLLQAPELFRVLYVPPGATVRQSLQALEYLVTQRSLRRKQEAL